MFALGLVIGVIWVLFDFRWVGSELRIRNRFARDSVVEQELPLKTRPTEHHSEEGRSQIKKIIQENSK